MALRHLNHREHTTVRAQRKDHDCPDDLPMIVCEPYFATVRRERIINHFTGSLSLALGELIGIVGPPGRGKTTLLRLISGNFLPEVFRSQDLPALSRTSSTMTLEEGMTNRIFVAPYLRMLHVPERPTFFYGTLLANLTYGCRLNDADSRPSRVRAICHALGLDDEVIDYLKDGDERKQSWGEVFSNTKICLLSLARALVFNPEILCCHKPVLPYSDEVKHEVMRILKDFVENRGVEQPDMSQHSRRPRTCLVTTSHMVGLSACHQLVYVHNFEMSILKRERADSGEEVVNKDGNLFSLTELTKKGGMCVGRNSLRDVKPLELSRGSSVPPQSRGSSSASPYSQDLSLRSAPSRETASVVQAAPETH
jgi:ABC-type branched-subunit amino acid transport system ATPase component